MPVVFVVVLVVVALFVAGVFGNEWLASRAPRRGGMLPEDVSRSRRFRA